MITKVCKQCGKEFITNDKRIVFCSKECRHKFQSIDIIGKKFNRLTVLEFHHKVQRYKKNGHKGGFREFYLCRCDCGNKTVVEKHQLITYATKSCGCLVKEHAKINFSKHNLTNHRLYNTWAHIKGRCFNPNNNSYDNYGGRGITMCDEWKKDFMNFYDWAITNGYKDDLTIDRIDVNGNYEPDNCRWVDMKVQANNKRNNFLVTIYNRTQTLSEWCDEKNLNYDKIQTRLNLGWTLEDAMTL